ncbi:hypothetical protein DL98DRAFT_516010 [Cadophora sp. DSE1049]|nr:hypothetical protein DL98DRAFT_516010 [Cadophora sp. DSE1049]
MVLLDLRSCYTKVRQLDQRQQSKSDGAGPRKESNRMSDLIQRINHLEVYLVSLQQIAKLQLQSLNISEEKAQVYKELMKYKFFANYGDYLAILHHEARNSLHGWEFPAHVWTTASRFVADLDAEMAAKDKDETCLTPLMDSVYAAHEFIGKIFGTPEELIACLRGYAERNDLFHSGVKDLVDDANYGKLYEMLVQDHEQLQFMDWSSDKQDFAKNILHSVSAAYFKKMDWQVGGKFLVNEMAEKRMLAKFDAAEKKGEEKSPLKKTEAQFRAKKAKLEVWESIDLEQDKRRKRYREISEFSEDLELEKADAMKSSLAQLEQQHADAVEQIRELKKLNEAVKERAEKKNADIKKQRKEHLARIAELEDTVGFLRHQSRMAFVGLLLLTVVVICKHKRA